MMERLTINEGVRYTYQSSSKLPFIIKKLGKYEDAEEQGLLIHLQCKVGDYVYQIDRMNNKINTKQIAQVALIQGKKSQSIQFDFETSGHCLHTDFGKTVFMNKVDAMNALNAKTEVKK